MQYAIVRTREGPLPMPLPADLAANRLLSRWVTIETDGTVTLRAGKVEIGQGITTALAQILADQLAVDFSRVRVVAVSTDSSPNEQITAGSRSLEDAGSAVRQVGAEIRALFAAAAARHLGSPVSRVVDGEIFAENGEKTSYWELRDEVSLETEATGEAVPVRERQSVGTSAPRIDLPDKIAGRPRFLHDLRPDGVLFGRVVRPPSRAAKLEKLDDEPARELAGVVEIVRDGSFLGVIAEREEVAIAAAELLREHTLWDEQPTLPVNLEEFLLSTETDDVEMSVRGATAEKETMTATYSRPYLAHASMGPSSAMARWDDDRVEVWSHTQGPYLLRTDLARAFELPPENVVVRHVEGAGCYGHNGADDAAFDAALLAQAVPGRPVHVVWSRADELAWAPLGAAMAVRLAASTGPDGQISSWQQDVYSNGHVTRPGPFPTPPLLGAAHRAGGTPIPVAVDPPYARGGGSDRNSVPLYDLPNHRVTKHRLLEMPLRTSSLRSLGAYLNIFAIESFVDELAATAGIDPVAYRLLHLRDDRAVDVVRAAAAAAGWADREEAEFRGYGFGFARYSNHGAYCAAVAQVHAESSVRVEKLTLAVDAGLVVNPDGLRNQIEGGAIQSTSWTVKEAVTFDRSRVTSDDWETYPILRFSEVPQVEITVVDRPELPSLGAGECAQGPVAAAIANALCDATGIRVRRLPLTPDHIIAAIDETPTRG
jgi:CO/xanthine dehydrogenase Mo-binding subunit